MSERTNTERVADTAVQWVRLCDQSRFLSELRGSCECKREVEWLEAGLNAAGKPQPKPCWKDFDAGEPLPREEWCPRCIERQRFHDELRRINRSRGARLRVLVRYSRQAIAAAIDAEETSK